MLTKEERAKLVEIREDYIHWIHTRAEMRDDEPEMWHMIIDQFEAVSARLEEDEHEKIMGTCYEEFTTEMMGWYYFDEHPSLHLMTDAWEKAFGIKIVSSDTTYNEFWEYTWRGPKHNIEKFKEYYNGESRELPGIPVYNLDVELESKEILKNLESYAEHYNDEKFEVISRGDKPVVRVTDYEYKLWQFVEYWVTNENEEETRKILEGKTEA